MMNRDKKGFTLIELSIVICTIAILAFTVTPHFFDMQNKSQESCAHQLLNSLKTSVMIYTAEEGIIPSDFSEFVVEQGKASGPIKLSLQNIADQLEEVKFNNDARTLEIVFNKGGKVLYTLNNVDVTAEFEF